MINHWAFNCRDVSILVSRGLDTRLSLSQRIGVRFHLTICRVCREHKRQLDLIHRALRRLAAPGNETAVRVPLPESTKRRILNQMPAAEDEPAPAAKGDGPCTWPG